MADEIKEKVALGHADHLVGNLNEQAEAFGRLEFEALSNVQAEILRPCAGVHFQRLKATRWLASNICSLL